MKQDRWSLNNYLYFFFGGGFLFIDIDIEYWAPKPIIEAPILNPCRSPDSNPYIIDP